MKTEWNENRKDFLVFTSKQYKVKQRQLENANEEDDGKNDKYDNFQLISLRSEMKLAEAVLPVTRLFFPLISCPMEKFLNEFPIPE